MSTIVYLDKGVVAAEYPVGWGADTDVGTAKGDVVI